MLTVLFIHFIANFFTIAAYMLIHYSWEPIILFFRTRLRRFYECFSVYTWIYFETELWLAVKKTPNIVAIENIELKNCLNKIYIYKVYWNFTLLFWFSCVFYGLQCLVSRFVYWWSVLRRKVLSSLTFID